MLVRIGDSALVDLDGIQRYYSHQGVPDVGKRLVAELVAHIERLVDHPDIGRVVPEFRTASLRELVHPPFRIVYWRETEWIEVIRVWRSERLLRLPDQE